MTVTHKTHIWTIWKPPCFFRKKHIILCTVHQLPSINFVAYIFPLDKHSRVQLPSIHHYESLPGGSPRPKIPKIVEGTAAWAVGLTAGVWPGLFLGDLGDQRAKIWEKTPKIYGVNGKCLYMWYIYIWVNYNISLTWISGKLYIY